jgi:hypothetical protein
MKTFIALVVFLLLLLWLTSCTIHNEKPQIITSIRTHEDQNHCHYKTNEAEADFIDKCGLFTIGDTVSIQKVHR